VSLNSVIEPATRTRARINPPTSAAATPCLFGFAFLASPIETAMSIPRRDENSLATDVVTPRADEPTVTVVIATYNRPSSLRWAIESVRRQTRECWRLLVIGDACSDDTAVAVAEFNDPRIEYINLPLRHGEQAGPNSVGAWIARSEYVAFLNHDDIWLPDHLAYALDALQGANAGLFIGRAAFSAPPGASAADDSADFVEVSPIRRSLAQAFWRPFFYFEPIGSWVVRRDVMHAVGPWYPSANLYRTSMVDWILRAWRADIGLAHCGKVTCLKSNSRGSGGEDEHGYALDVLGPEDWLRSLASAPLEAFRERIAAEVRRAATEKRSRGFDACFPNNQNLQWLAERLLTPAAGEVFKRTGWDSYEGLCKAAGLGPGWSMRGALKRRTGEDLPHVAPPFQEMCEAAELQLSRRASEHGRQMARRA